MKQKIIDALVSGAVYVIGIGAIALVMFGLPGYAHASGQIDFGGKLDGRLPANTFGARNWSLILDPIYDEVRF